MLTEQLDLILNADSLTKLVKLMYVARRPLVVFCCIFWLLVNLVGHSTSIAAFADTCSLLKLVSQCFP